MRLVVQRRLRALPKAWVGTLLLAVVGCQSSAEPAQPSPAKPDADVVVHLGYQKTGAPFLLKVRDERLRGRLSARGARVEWVEFQAGPPLLEAMRGGGVDIGHTGEAPPIFAQSGGVPFVYVASDAPSPKAEAILVPKDSPIQQLSELKGKRIALNRGSNVHYLLLRALESAGLSVADVQPVYLAPPDARSAFENGSVDAWVIWDPFLAAAELKGARVLRDGEGLVDNRFFYLARRAFAEAHPELLAIVLSEFETLSAWAKGHPEQASELLAESSGVSYEALLRSERRHVYVIEPIDEGILARQQTIADAFVGLQIIPQPIRTHDAVRARSISWASKP